jgi:protein-tyrosine phosphatase
MVDIHCHILPEVDDGAGSWDIAVEMCRMAAQDGITHIVATPHANHQYSYDRDRHLGAVQELMARSGGVPEIQLGCDFHFSYDNVQDALANPSRYVLGNSNYLLVELSDYSIAPSFLETLRQLMQVGLRPVITHPERNLLLRQRPELVLDWAEQGIIVQVTANSLTGHWGRTAKKTARWLLERKAVHVLATDAHDTQRRPPLLSPACQVMCEWVGEQVTQALVEQNPAAMLRSEDLPYFEKPER